MIGRVKFVEEIDYEQLWN